MEYLMIVFLVMNVSGFKTWFYSEIYFLIRKSSNGMKFFSFRNPHKQIPTTLYAYHSDCSLFE